MGLPTIIVSGYLARDPEMQYTQTDQTLTRCSIPINRQERVQNGEEREETDWYNIVAWGRLAESLNQYGQKGRFVTVVGRVKQNRYTRTDGVVVTNIDVTASDVNYGPRTDRQNGSGGSDGYGSQDDYQPQPAGYEPQQGGNAGRGSFGSPAGFPAAQGAAAPTGADEGVPW